VNVGQNSEKAEFAGFVRVVRPAEMNRAERMRVQFDARISVFF
jgi:hypothetical protein